MPTPPPNLTTPRLTLRGLQAGDAEQLFSYRSHPQVARFQGWVPESTADAEAFIASQDGVGWLQPDSWFQLAIEGQDPKELLGDIGVHTLEDARQVELGVSLAPTAQGNGLATEALRALLDHLFTDGTHRVFASVDPENTAACELLERLGLRKEAHFRKSYWFRGAWVDDVVFGILREEWSLDPGETRT